MADVYLVSARGPAGFAKLLVIKELRPELAHASEFIHMFMNEARLAARLAHPNVVQTYDVTRTASRFFLAMEYLDGQPLHRVLARLDRENDDVRRLYLASIVSVLAGLHYAHELKDYDGTPLGIVHRDVSPHNLFVLYNGHVKLVDFGIAKASTDSVDTRSGVVKGKAAYMAPEQATSAHTDRRADIYACGIMLWEALAGRRIWAGLDDVGIIGRLLVGSVPSLQEAAPDVPKDLALVCSKALSARPEDRYMTAEAMRGDLVTAIRKADWGIPAEKMGAVVASAFESERAELATLLREHMEEASKSKRLTSLAELSAQAARDRTPMVFEAQSSAGSFSDHEATRLTGPNEVHEVRLASKRKMGLAVLGAATIFTLALLLYLRGGATRDPPSPQALRLAPTSAYVTSLAGGCDSANKPTVELSGEIESDSTLSCDRNYLLKFNVFVVPGTTLTIEKGTTILGDRATHSALVVQPGGRLVAEGTADEPIVFTSALAPENRAPGDWGGVVLLGRAPTNLTDEAGNEQSGNVEGLTFGGAYGGSDPGDDSGVLRYVRIEYPGNELAPGNELNGLTLAGVGRGTVLEYVQVREASDDCFEFFGGTVDGKHLICQASGDDGFDWDLGYQGRLQFLILQQKASSDGGDNGFEGDNDPNGSENEPRSSPVIFNATLCGKNMPEAKPSFGVLARRSTRVRIANSIIAGFHAGLDVRDRGTDLVIEGSILADNVVHAVAYDERTNGNGAEQDDDFGVNETELFASGRGNSTRSAKLTDCFDPSEPNFAPRMPGATPVTVPDDGFFESAPYVGAVSGEDDEWYKQSWTRWADH